MKFTEVITNILILVAVFGAGALTAPLQDQFATMRLNRLQRDVDRERELVQMQTSLLNQTINKDIKKLVKLNEYALNEYACTLVNDQIPKDDRSGCYDWCYSHAMWIETKNNAIHEFDNSKTWPSGIDNGKYPIALTDEFSHDLQNACAIVMHGGEF